jgi:hypothetical protein
MTTKLHELLAVETNLENQANKCRTDLAETFAKKRHLFEEKRLLFTPLEEGKPAQVEAQSEMASTVAKELTWIQGHMIKALDASYQVADANTRARADIILDDDKGTILAKGIPATALLELEKRCVEVQQLIAAIPTLDPAKGFKPDKQRGEGIYVAREVVKTRTQKQPKVIVKYDATKEHPAQTELFSVDAPIGRIEEQEWSALITPGEKSELLDRIEMLTRAVRRARSRANDTEVDLTQKIGKALLNFVFGK